MIKWRMQFKVFQNRKIIQGISDISFGSMRGNRGNKRAVKFLRSLGYKVKPGKIVWAEQVFGAKVHICKIKDSGKTIKGADGLISNIKNQVLAIVVADCLPILIYDPKKEVVAALHGSRKSLQKGIIKNAVSKMVSKFNVNSRDILAGLSPHIRKCHYFMDLTRLALGDLLKSGLKRKNIEDCKICTFCSAVQYFSHRKRVDNPRFYKEKCSRFASFIGLKETEALKISNKNFQEIVKTAVKFIKQGKILVCPTDTVYGMIGDAMNKKAVEKLFKIKKRQLNKPVPIFVKDIKTAKKLAHIDKKQEKFLEKVWPGKVTAVLKRTRLRQGFGGRGKRYKLYGVDKNTIGLRIPKHKLVTELLKKINKPLIGTSANISGKPASAKIKEVIKQFQNQKHQPDLIINAGDLPKSRPSKVVDLTGAKIKVLRK